MRKMHINVMYLSLSPNSSGGLKEQKMLQAHLTFSPFFFSAGITNAKAHAVKRLNAANFHLILRRVKLLFAGTDQGISPKHSLACWDHEQLFSPRFCCVLELCNR